MDKEGFKLIDAEFQKEMNEAKKRIHDKYHQQFLQKQYVGTREMKAQARAKDRADMQDTIRKELEEERRKREALHFEGNSRDGWLETFKTQEKEAVNDNKDKDKNTPSAKDAFNREADDKAARMEAYNTRMKEHARQKEEERQREMENDRGR